MAILSNLLVNGESRLLGKLYANDVGIGGKITATQIHIDTTKNAENVTSDNSSLAPLVIGQITGKHIAIDADEIAAKSNATTGTSLYLNYGGGIVYLSNGGSIYASNGTFRAATVIAATSLGDTNNYVPNAYITTATITTANITAANTNKINNADMITTSAMDVKGKLHAVEYDLENIMDLGGSFVVAPTLIVPSSGSGTKTLTVSKSNDTTVVLTVKDPSITSTGIAGFAWANNYKVKVSGLINNTVLGTCDGYINSTNVSSNTISLTVTMDSATVTAIATTVSNYKLNIMLYNTDTSSATAVTKPLGIYLQHYQLTNNPIINVWNGQATTPKVRIGYLGGITYNGSSLGTNAQNSWGLYSDNVFLEGQIVAKGGKIGGYSIGTSNLTKGTTQDASGSFWLTPEGQSATMSHLSSSAQTWAMTVGQDFGVTTSGSIYTHAGYIAGWKIENNDLVTGTWGSENSAMLCTGTSSSKSIGGSSSINGWVFTAGNKFGVTKDGALYCNDIHATGGTISGSLVAGKLTAATIDGDKITANTITAGQIASNAITADELAANAVTAVKIQTGAVTADKLDATTINASKKLTVGAMTDTAANSILNSELEIGGRNLFRYTSLTDVVSNKWIKNGTVACSANGDKLTITGAGEVYPTSNYYTPYVIPIGTTITLSCYFYENTVSDGNRYIYYAVTPGWRNKRVPANYVGLWQETFTLTEELTVLCPEYDLRNSTGGKWVVSPLKLEIGNKATAWSPAPEDTASTATDYITQIDSNGIWVTPSGKKPSDTSTGAGATGTRINADGMQIFKGGVQVASYGDGAVIGKSSSYHTAIDSNGMHIYNGDSTPAEVAKFTSSGAVIGKSSSAQITLNSNTMQLSDKNGNVFFKAYNASGDNGYVTNYFNGDGVKKTFTLLYTAVNSTYVVTVNGETASPTKTNSDFTFTNPPSADAIIVAQYYAAWGSISYDLGIRKSNTVTGSYSLIQGKDLVASGKYSLATGENCEANGPSSFAGGYYCKATGYSFAYGNYSEATGGFSVALGHHAVASGLKSYAIGDVAVAKAEGSVSIGNLTTAASRDQTVVGSANIEDTEGKYVFIVGNGKYPNYTRSNALTVDWDGGLQCGNIKCGVFQVDNCNAYAMRNITITFSKPFKTGELPCVVAMFAGGAGSYTFGNVQLSVSERSNTSFTIRIYNATNTAISPYVHWIATTSGQQ